MQGSIDSMYGVQGESESEHHCGLFSIVGEQIMDPVTWHS